MRQGNEDLDAKISVSQFKASARCGDTYLLLLSALRIDSSFGISARFPK